MGTSEYENKLLQYKKTKAYKTVSMVCEYCNLPKPHINFDGCPTEGINGPELAHYHTGGVNQICISARQLEMQNYDELENTCIHEVVHHLGLIHGSSDERVYFEKIKNYVKSRSWRPERSGSQFVSTEQVRESDERIRQDPKRLAEINEDSDYIKFIEGRATSRMEEQSEKQSPNAINTEKVLYKERTSNLYKSMSKTSIAEAREKLGIKAEEDRPKPKLDEKEQERLTNKAYENMDTGFGDKHGENRWTKKKKGFLGMVKYALGID